MLYRRGHIGRVSSNLPVIPRVDHSQVEVRGGEDRQERLFQDVREGLPAAAEWPAVAHVKADRAEEEFSIDASTSFRVMRCTSLSLEASEIRKASVISEKSVS